MQPALKHSHQKLHERAHRSARRFISSEAALIEVLMCIDQERIHIRLGYSSLFQYVTKDLKLSEAIACNLIAIARKAQNIPELHQKIKTGEISTSKARRILPVLTIENQKEWFAKAITLTTRQIEKEVARINPKAATPERATYVSQKRLSLELGIEESLLLDLRRIQDQVSRSQNRSASLEETLAVLVQFYLSKKNPLEKAKRIVSKKGTPTQSLNQPHLQSRPSTPSSETSPSKSRTPIPAKIIHSVRLRDQERCQFKLPDGSQCNERRWIELHHIKPINEGGEHKIENLVTLCQGHHQSMHLDQDYRYILNTVAAPAPSSDSRA